MRLREICTTLASAAAAATRIKTALWRGGYSPAGQRVPSPTRRQRGSSSVLDATMVSSSTHSAHSHERTNERAIVAARAAKSCCGNQSTTIATTPQHHSISSVARCCSLLGARSLAAHITLTRLILVPLCLVLCRPETTTRSVEFGAARSTSLAMSQDENAAAAAASASSASAATTTNTKKKPVRLHRVRSQSSGLNQRLALRLPEALLELHRQQMFESSVVQQQQQHAKKQQQHHQQYRAKRKSGDLSLSGAITSTPALVAAASASPSSGSLLASAPSPSSSASATSLRAAAAASTAAATAASLDLASFTESLEAAAAAAAAASTTAAASSRPQPPTTAPVRPRHPSAPPPPPPSSSSGSASRSWFDLPPAIALGRTRSNTLRRTRSFSTPPASARTLRPAASDTESDSDTERDSDGLDGLDDSDAPTLNIHSFAEQGTTTTATATAPRGRRRSHRERTNHGRGLDPDGARQRRGALQPAGAPGAAQARDAQDAALCARQGRAALRAAAVAQRRQPARDAARPGLDPRVPSLRQPPDRALHSLRQGALLPLLLPLPPPSPRISSHLILLARSLARERERSLLTHLVR